MQASASRPFYSSPIVAAVAAVILRLAALFAAWRWRPWVVVNPLMSGGEVVSIAHSIVAGKGFGNPLGVIATGPTAWVCPAYPYLVAGVFQLRRHLHGKIPINSSGTELYFRWANGFSHLWHCQANLRDQGSRSCIMGVGRASVRMANTGKACLGLNVKRAVVYGHLLGDACGPWPAPAPGMGLLWCAMGHRGID